MLPGETVGRALRRLCEGQTHTPAAGRRPHYVRKEEKIRQPQTNSAILKESKARADRLTELADELMSRGKVIGIYDMSYEAISNSLLQWEYQGQDGTLYGPYRSEQIAEWISNGYFTGASAVYMRTVGRVRSSTASVEHSTADIEPVSKRPKAEPASKDNSDLMGDLEDNDDDGNDNHVSDKRSSSKSNSSNGQDVKGNAAALSKGPWMLSDTIDFGEYITLPEGNP